MTIYTGTIATVASGDTTTVPTNLATYRDALKAASEAWTTFGTGANWTGTVSNPAIGNGIWNGRYAQVTKLVDFSVKITMGTTTTYGSGVFQITLPVAPNTSHPAHFDCMFTDTSSGLFYRGLTTGLSGSKVNLTYDASTAGGQVSAVGSAAPFTWANTDILEVWGRYETT